MFRSRHCSDVLQVNGGYNVIFVLFITVINESKIQSSLLAVLSSPRVQVKPEAIWVHTVIRIKTKSEPSFIHKCVVVPYPKLASVVLI